MKQKIEKIINQLTDKSYTEGCILLVDDGYEEFEWALCDCCAEVTEIKRDNKRLGVKRGEIYFDHGDGYMTRSRVVKVLGHPVRIGDVLEKIYKQHDFAKSGNLLELWFACDFTKSLQQIFQDCEWGKEFRHNPSKCTLPFEKHCICSPEFDFEKVPKDPAKKALAESLINIFYENPL